MNFEVRFVDTSHACVRALRAAFSDIAGVSARVSDIDGSEVGARRPSCIASAGQSFGMMDGEVRGPESACGRGRRTKSASAGNVDEAVRSMLSYEAERWVQRAILDEYAGELPVGSCVVLAAPQCTDYIAYASTMRVPEDVSGTLNAYLAFRAVLVEVVRFRPAIKTLICPTFCTGCGEMRPAVAAAQMRLAWDSVFVDRPRAEWDHIYARHERLRASLLL